MSEEAAYPAAWEFDAVLADGGTVHVRPVLPSDAEEVRAFHERQSPESIYFRFFSPRPKLSDRDVQRLVQVDHAQRVAFVAWIGDRIVGMAGYDIWRARTEADVWFLVDDDEKGRGLATILLEYLAEAARRNGLTGLTAQVLPSNQRMLGVFRSVGFETTSAFEDGVIEVRLGIDPTPETLARIAERERAAEARSVERLLRPATVAVIGASRRPDSIGHVIFRNLVERGFTGTVFPVNPTGEPVAGVRSYPSINDVPEVVDVAVVAVPALAVLDVVEACGHRRVGGLIVVSAGFGAYGPYGTTGERLIVERARLFGMRVIGPESLGAINTDPTVSLHASVARTAVAPGPVAYLAQSGTLGIAALEHARRVGIGFSSFVDVGAKVDVSGNDLLQFWEQDPATRVIALHLESFGNPRKFTRIARRIARTTPIVAVRTRKDLRPVGPLPGTRPSEPAAAWPVEATVDALLDQSGVISADTPTELFDIARVVAQQGAVRGPAVAVVSNSTGGTNLTADALAVSGLASAALAEHTRGVLASVVPDGGAVAGPVDLTFAAGAADYRAALDAVLRDPGVDACVVIHAPALAADTDEVATAIADAVAAARADGPTPPVVAILLGREVGAPVRGADVEVPVFEFPSEAVRALGRLHRWQQWVDRSEAAGEDVAPEATDGLRAVAARVLDAEPDGRWLERVEAETAMAALGFDVLASAVVDGLDGAVEAAERLGYPVVLKVPVDRPRPTDAGGVALGLRDEAELRMAWSRLAELHQGLMSATVVQPMAPSGPELRVSGHQHAGYGAVLGLAMGGPVAVTDTSLPVRVLPMSAADAAVLLDASPVHRLVEAMPDPAAGRSAVLAFLQRVASVLDAVPEVQALIIGSAFVHEATVAIAEVAILVAPDVWEPADRVRRLD